MGQRVGNQMGHSEVTGWGGQSDWVRWRSKRLGGARIVCNAPKVRTRVRLSPIHCRFSIGTEFELFPGCFTGFKLRSDCHRLLVQPRAPGSQQWSQIKMPARRRIGRVECPLGGTSGMKDEWGGHTQQLMAGAWDAGKGKGEYPFLSSDGTPRNKPRR